MKILQMTTYDVENPDHGGKLRSYHIRKSLRMRYTVETLSFEWGDHDDTSTLQTLLNQERWEDFGLHGLLIDWQVCTYLERVNEVYAAVAANVLAYAPDALLIDQPFLWPLAQRFFCDGTVRTDAKIIYSSYNIEARMKRKIYRDAFPSKTAQKYIEHVETIEKGVITNAHIALAVSKNDSDYISGLAPNVPVRVFINGHTRPVHNGQAEKWRRLFADHEFNWVFVSSWHSPNINGLRSLLAAMPDGIDSKQFALWILGSVGNGLLAMEGFYPKDYPYVKIMGPVSGEDIDAAILDSSGVVLPIWEGGGTNLKTAQALLSGKCIVGSNFSFRGFESFMGEKGVFLSDTPEEVSSLILETIPQNSYIRSQGVADLEWEQITKNLVDYISQC